MKTISTYTNLLLMTLCLFALTACGKPKTVTYYMQHPVQIQKTLAYCAKLEALKRSQNKQCQLADHANEQLTANLLAFKANPLDFGQRILKLQMNIAKLRQQHTSNQKIIAQQSAKLAQLLAVVRIAETGQ